MADAKKDDFAIAKNLTSPKGVAVFPHLNTPDFKFKKETGEYRVKLKLDGEAAEKFKAFIDETLAGAIPKLVEEKKKSLAKKPALAAKVTAENLEMGAKPYSPDLDKEGNETGATVFNFKRAAKITYTPKGAQAPVTKEIKPDIFDAKGVMMKGKLPLIFGGSVMKVNYDVLPYVTPVAGAGITLRMNAVQIIELKSQGDRDASAYGFGTEEGYEAPSGAGFGDESGGKAGGEGGGEGGAGDGAANPDF